MNDDDRLRSLNRNGFYVDRQEPGQVRLNVTGLKMAPDAYALAH